MEKVTCTHCGEDNKTNARYCSHCGYELPKATPESSNQPNQQSQKSKPTNRKPLLVTIVGIIAFGIAYFVAQQVFSPPSIDQQLMKIANELNESCPVMVDAGTRLDNTITTPEKRFQYNYTLVDMLKENIEIESMEAYLKPQILNTIRTSPDLKFFREKGVTLVYNYKDKNSVHVLRLEFAPNEYKTD